MLSQQTLHNINYLLKINTTYFQMDQQQLEMRQHRIMQSSLDSKSFDQLYKTNLKVAKKFEDLTSNGKEQKQQKQTPQINIQTKIKTTNDNKQIGQKYEPNNVILDQDYYSVNLYDKPLFQSCFQHNEFKKNKRSNIKHDNVKIRKMNAANNQKIVFVGTFRLAEIGGPDQKKVKDRYFMIYDDKDIVGNKNRELRKLVYDDDQDTDEELMFEHQQVVLKDLFSNVI